jgi:FKBP-type peptidyl-prolyl cis-trans isomerase FkpA
MIRLLFFITGFIICSCSSDEGVKAVEWNQEKSTAFNRELALEQDLQIKMYLEQHSNWRMVSTGSGLSYFVYQQGNGVKAEEGMTAQVETEISLLDGRQCYKTATDEMEEFVIDKSDIESGIQEGIKKMREGDRAKMIIPSHLAHGLVGDLDKIPPLSVIVVDIHLIGLLP